MKANADNVLAEFHKHKADVLNQMTTDHNAVIQAMTTLLNEQRTHLQTKLDNTETLIRSKLSAEGANGIRMKPSEFDKIDSRRDLQSVALPKEPFPASTQTGQSPENQAETPESEEPNKLWANSSSSEFVSRRSASVLVARRTAAAANRTSTVSKAKVVLPRFMVSGESPHRYPRTFEALVAPVALFYLCLWFIYS